MDGGRNCWAHSATPAPALFLNTLDTFVRQNWGLSELKKLAPSVAWHVDPKSIDLFAALLCGYCIEFDDPAGRLGSGSASEDRVPNATGVDKKHGALLLKAFEELNARRSALAFTRALPIASLLDDALEGASPVRVIERYMHQIFRPDPPIRTDWSFPASLYFKAIEHELILRYASSCREADDCSKGEEKDVSFGQVVFFLRQASQGNPQRSAILTRSNLTPAPNAVLKHLDRFRDKYRNPSAHPKPFDQALLSALRWELFGERVLRDILEWLAPAGNIRIAP